jgi:hypothetical protein
MTRKSSEPRSKNDATQVGSLQPSGQTHDVLSTDVRSIVELQYLLMEQAHDRIRVAELAAHLHPDQLDG